MKKYTKTTWKDRLVQHPNRFRDQDGNFMTLTPEPGEVAEIGTLVEAKIMNNLEDGVELATDMIISILETIGIYEDTYSNSKTYKAGNTVVKNYKVYRCKVDITEPEEFDESKWERKSLLRKKEEEEQ